MSEQRVEAPTAAELEWVRDNLKLAESLAKVYAGAEPGTALTLADLDTAFANWLNTWHAVPPDERDDPNPYINGFGLAFGQALVDDVGLEWAVVTDEHGTDIAVHGQPGDVLVFPTNFVAKRFERGETRFMQSSLDKIRSRVEELRT